MHGIKLIKLKGFIGKFSITLNTSLSVTDRTSRYNSVRIYKISTALSTISKVIKTTFNNQRIVLDFFLSTHGTFTQIDHMLYHKLSLNKLQRTEIFQSVFSHHIKAKLEINNKNLHLTHSLYFLKTIHSLLNPFHRTYSL